MKLNEIKDIIRKIVREEISDVLQGSVLVKNSPDPVNESATRRKTMPQIKTGNPVLDEVISNTSPLPRELTESVSMDSPFEQTSAQVPTTASPLPDFLKRDYRTLLKATEQKAKVHRGANGPL